MNGDWDLARARDADFLHRHTPERRSAGSVRAKKTCHMRRGFAFRGVMPHTPAHENLTTRREPKWIAVVSFSPARRAEWVEQLRAVPEIEVAGGWASVEQAEAAGVRLDAILVDVGRGGPPPGRGGEASLSPRESQVLALLAAGCRDKELPERLGTSGNTARTYLRRAMGKMGAASRTEAVARWLRDGRNGDMEK